ncbi:hypothetical protein MC7420_5035 [Coleofasciculus chthonoplastes PCC 7420]|uniref:YdbS-like PH domain-containing protein n=1 Tax=Coleofasciculus chthonoplastes PCC 7420 TaxID=118168 RepID=B4W1I4_9CYAN|nr:hypothetical protein MC7420_5035 [Coleofasciculus chthonoplastes PCC 7420]
MIINILLGFTVIALPLTIGAVVRALWLRYRVTNRRISVTGGWQGRDRTDIIYSEIAQLRKVPRGIGLWGDIVVILKDGSRLELRAMPQFREIYDYIGEKVSAKTGKPLDSVKA